MDYLKSRISRLKTEVYFTMPKSFKLKKPLTEVTFNELYQKSPDAQKKKIDFYLQAHPRMNRIKIDYEKTMEDIAESKLH